MGFIKKNKNSEMPFFIQGMYATVLGVGFYKIALQNSSDWVLVQNFRELLHFFSLKVLWRFFTSEFFFRFLLFAFTLLLIAHNWFFYHLEKRQNRNESYWHYTPQIFALFFIAQMFGAIEVLNLQYWYVFAFFYSICNLINTLIIYDKRRDKIIQYSIHSLISIVTFLLIPSNFAFPDYHIALATTSIIIIILWFFKPKISSNETPEEIISL